MNKLIGNNIRRIRLFKDVLTGTMAQKLGISVSAYTKIERGETNIDVKRLELLAKALEVKVSLITSLDTDRLLNDPIELFNMPDGSMAGFKEADGNYLVPKPVIEGLVSMMRSSERLLEKLLRKIDVLENR